MAEFKWHLMSEEKPDEGNGNYILLGNKGAMYYANHYHDVGLFHVPNNRANMKSDNEIKAWAEIPMFGSDDTCHNVAAPPDEGFWPMPHFECSICGASYVTSEYVYFCPNCGRKVVQR